MQNWAWADLLECIIPEAMRIASDVSDDKALRDGLPRNFLEYMGVMHDNDFLIKSLRSQDGRVTGAVAPQEKMTLKKRNVFRAALKARIDNVAKEAMKLVDYGCDEISKRFLSDRLPPAFSEEELATTNDNNENGDICAETLVRIARAGIARVIVEGDKAIVYHCADNSRVYHGVPLSPMEFELDDAPCIEKLLCTVAPMWLPVKDLPHPPAEDLDDKIEIVQSLYGEGIVAVRQPDFLRERLLK